jgi:hypothetical protein
MKSSGFSNSHFDILKNKFLKGRAWRPHVCPYRLRTSDNSQISPVLRRGDSLWSPHILAK